jgi:hypothetical protein
MIASDPRIQHVIATLRARYRTWRPRRPPDDGPSSGGPPPRLRRIEITGLLIGLSIGSAVILALLTHGVLVRADGLPARTGSGVRQPAEPAPDPAALDAEWAAYSDRSTCADWAGGDGISAVRLNSSQTAWFFSDTFLGPAGPTAGFSRSAGLVHNSVVVQTTTGRKGGFVTLAGGGTCGARSRRA